MINKFSVTSMMETNKKREQLRLRRKSTKLGELYNKKTNKNYLQEDVVNILKSFGYDLSQIMTAFKKYNFLTTEEAVIVMMKDNDIDKYVHEFVPLKDTKICMICYDKPEEHFDLRIEEEAKNKAINKNLDYLIENNSFVVRDNQQPIEIESNNKNEIEVNNILKPDLIYNNNKKLVLPKGINIEELENPNLCRICFDSLLVEGDKDTISFTDCSHIFCKKCVLTYIKSNIINGKVLN